MGEDDDDFFSVSEVAASSLNASGSITNVDLRRAYEEIVGPMLREQTRMQQAEREAIQQQAMSQAGISQQAIAQAPPHWQQSYQELYQMSVPSIQYAPGELLQYATVTGGLSGMGSGTSYSIGIDASAPTKKEDSVATKKDEKMKAVISAKVTKLREFMRTYSRSEIADVLLRKDNTDRRENFESEIVRYCLRQLESGNRLSGIADTVYYGFEQSKFLP